MKCTSNKLKFENFEIHLNLKNFLSLLHLINFVNVFPFNTVTTPILWNLVIRREQKTEISPNFHISQFESED